jgi:DNA topoisomerase IB
LVPGITHSLRFTTDSTPGISRHRRRHRKKLLFYYRTPKGRPVRDSATLERIRKLAIPPAYEKVWISPHPRGHLQATGRDARGRKQYRYHPVYRQEKEELKHARMHQFGRCLPRLRRMLRTDLKLPGLPREKVLALVIALMDSTQVRVGNKEYARTNGSFGLTTLLDRHARFARGGKGVLRFPGKSGTLHEVPIEDRHLAGLVRKCQHLPGQHLFQYLDEAGQPHSIDSTQINDYLHRHLGGDFTAKDFRTWHATLKAYELLLGVPRPDPCTDTACRRELKKIVCEVAVQLRNTPAVCRKSYINPLVLTAWEEGRPPFDRPAGERRRGLEPLLTLLK